MRSPIHCACLLLVGVLMVACGPASAPADNSTTIDLRLNVLYDDPYDIASSGTWQLVAKCQGDTDTTAYGISGLEVLLTGVTSVTAAAPTGIVNAADQAGFNEMDVSYHSNYLDVVIAQIQLTAPLPPGDQQPLLYDVGTLENGSPDDPGYSGPAITLSDTSGIPWATGDALGDAAWNTAAVMLTGTFLADAMPDYGFFADAEHVSAGNIFTSVPGSSQGVGTEEFADIVNWSVRTNLLVSGLPGDYNNNGVVDAADYTTWRDNLGSSISLPNDTTPGSVDPEDYDVWKANFGATAGAGAGGQTALAAVSGSVAAVPEPASWILLAGAAGMLFFRRISPFRR